MVKAVDPLGDGHLRKFYPFTYPFTEPAVIPAMILLLNKQ